MSRWLEEDGSNEGLLSNINNVTNSLTNYTTSSNLTNATDSLYDSIDIHNTNDSILQVKKQGESNVSNIQMRDSYDLITFNSESKHLVLNKGSSSTIIPLPITDPIEQSPFLGLNFVDGNDLPTTRASINAQLLSPPTGGFALDNGFTISAQHTFTSQNFTMNNVDGLGILEFYFGDVSLAANDLIMKIETLDYKSFKSTNNWADMQFKTDANNKFCGVFNNGSNDVIKVFDNGWFDGEKVFLHDTTANNPVNPAAYGNNGGSGPGGTPIGQFQNKLPQVRAASGILHDWNYANRNHSPSNGFLSLHYVSKGDSAIGFTNTDAEITNGSFGGLSYFGTYKTGPEILNGGKLSIATGDHVMIQINENTIEYYKNGTLVSSETQTGSNGSRIGGVVNLRRKLILGGASNTGSFTLKKINWYGNKKSTSDANAIYIDRDFISGGGSGTSDVDLTPYINGASLSNNVLKLTSAIGEVSLPLRDSYLKNETDARIAPLESGINNITTTQAAETTRLTNCLADVNNVQNTLIGQNISLISHAGSITNLNNQVNLLTNLINSLPGGGGGGGGGWNPF